MSENKKIEYMEDAVEKALYLVNLGINFSIAKAMVDSGARGQADLVIDCYAAAMTEVLALTALAPLLDRRPADPAEDESITVGGSE